MMSYHNPQKIFVIIALYFVLVLMRLTSESTELKGTVIAVQGDDVTVKVKSAGTIQPAVSDMLSILEPTRPKTTSIETIIAEEAYA